MSSFIQVRERLRPVKFAAYMQYKDRCACLEDDFPYYNFPVCKDLSALGSAPHLETYYRRVFGQYLHSMYAFRFREEFRDTFIPDHEQDEGHEHVVRCLKSYNKKAEKELARIHMFADLHRGEPPPFIDDLRVSRKRLTKKNKPSRKKKPREDLDLLLKRDMQNRSFSSEPSFSLKKSREEERERIKAVTAFVDTLIARIIEVEKDLGACPCPKPHYGDAAAVVTLVYVIVLLEFKIPVFKLSLRQVQEKPPSAIRILETLSKLRASELVAADLCRRNIPFPCRVYWAYTRRHDPGCFQLSKTRENLIYLTLCDFVKPLSESEDHINGVRRMQGIGPRKMQASEMRRTLRV